MCGTITDLIPFTFQEYMTTYIIFSSSIDACARLKKSIVAVVTWAYEVILCFSIFFSTWNCMRLFVNPF